MNQDSYETMIATKNSWWNSSRRKIVKAVLSFFLLDKNQKILEIGCGAGSNLNMLSNFGSIRGIEMEEKSRNAAKLINKNIEPGSLPDNIKATEKASLICMLDVLEHIEEDIKSLQKINELLFDGGKLLITVPAYNFLWNNHDDQCHHKRRYTRKELKIKAERTGFKIIYSTYFNTFLFVPFAIAKMGLKIINYQKNELRVTEKPTLLNSFLNKFFEKIFSFESKFIPRAKFRFGISILLLAEKIEPDSHNK